MRWYYIHPAHGDERTRSFFAFFPFTIGGETRWLERVTILEVYRVSKQGLDAYWSRVRFIDPVRPVGA
jgi:hypothetical protein